MATEPEPVRLTPLGELTNGKLIHPFAQPDTNPQLALKEQLTPKGGNLNRAPAAETPLAIQRGEIAAKVLAEFGVREKLQFIHRGVWDLGKGGDLDQSTRTNDPEMDERQRKLREQEFFIKTIEAGILASPTNIEEGLSDIWMIGYSLNAPQYFAIKHSMSREIQTGRGRVESRTDRDPVSGFFRERDFRYIPPKTEWVSVPYFEQKAYVDAVVVYVQQGLPPEDPRANSLLLRIYSGVPMEGGASRAYLGLGSSTGDPSFESVEDKFEIVTASEMGRNKYPWQEKKLPLPSRSDGLSFEEFWHQRDLRLKRLITIPYPLGLIYQERYLTDQEPQFAQDLAQYCEKLGRDIRHPRVLRELWK